MFLFLHKLISSFLELKLNYECATSLAASELVEVACQPGLFFFWGGGGGGKIKREKKVGGERENEPARKLMIVFRDQPPN